MLINIHTDPDEATEEINALDAQVHCPGKDGPGRRMWLESSQGLWCAERVL